MRAVIAVVGATLAAAMTPVAGSSSEPSTAYRMPMAFNSFVVCPLAFAYGGVGASAMRVRVELASGATRQTHTIAPPRGLSHDVRYFAVRIPCGSRVIGLSTG